MKSNTRKDKILFFDSECLLCNSAIKFILRHEKKKDIYFCSLNSAYAKDFLVNYFENKPHPQSIFFFNGNKIYIKSTAVLQLSKHLKGFIPLFFLFSIVPAFFRDKIYDFIARNRYKWFGKINSCIIPDKVNIERFIS